MSTEQELEAQRVAADEAAREPGEQPAGQGDDQVEPETAPPEESENFEEIVAKRGAKNVIEENRRKAKEAADLKSRLAEKESELAALQTQKPAEQPKEAVKEPLPQEIEEWENALKEQGYDENYISKQRKAMIRMASSMVDYKLRKADKVLYKDDLDTSIDKLKNNDNYKFVISKLEPELKAEAMKWPGENWSNEAFIEVLLGRLIAQNQNKLFGNAKEPKEKPDLPIEGAPEHGDGSGGKYTQKEIDNYAAELGIEMTTPENKRSVKESFLARKKALETMNKSN